MVAFLITLPLASQRIFLTEAGFHEPAVILRVSPTLAVPLILGFTRFFTDGVTGTAAATTGSVRGAWATPELIPARDAVTRTVSCLPTSPADGT